MGYEQAAPSDDYQITTPLKDPRYSACNMVGGFELTDTLNACGDFIFKGRIDKISEINITWKQVNKQDSYTVDHWLTSCDVTIENILYWRGSGY